jgi:L-alanine-DL-glutamate epimerase-like enolase superfamily enzyme
VRVYNGGLRFPIERFTPEEYADSTRRMLAAPEGFTIVKQPIGFHSGMKRAMPDFFYGQAQPVGLHGALDRGALTERGLARIVACVEAMKAVTGDAVGLALDCGPGFSPSDALRLARALEPYNLLWLEDMITGDYTPYVLADLYRDVTWATTTPIHTGEQIYLRQNFKELLDRRAVNVIGSDPADVGGIAELKWIAEYADLNGIMMAPHGVLDGLIGLAALVQVSATLPHNFIAFEYPLGRPAWWYDVVRGLPDPIVQGGQITVWDRPGLGVELDVEAATAYLRDEDRAFFD